MGSNPIQGTTPNTGLTGFERTITCHIRKPSSLNLDVKHGWEVSNADDLIASISDDIASLVDVDAAVLV